MTCQLRLSLISRTELYVYGGLFILGAILASLVNLVSVIVLWMPKQRTKSNFILTSLVSTDLLTGFILFPLNAYQVLREDQVFNCTLDLVRGYIAVLLAGCSALTLGIVAFDRYILLTRYPRYDHIVSKRNIYILLTFAWLFPLVVPLTRYVDTKLYLFLLILVFLGPLIVLIIIYILLVKAIMKVQKNLESHKQKDTLGVDINEVGSSSASEMDKSRIENVGEDANNGEQATKKLSKTTALTNDKSTTKWKKSQQKSVKLGKSVAILIFCYFLCFVTLNVWIILDLCNNLMQLDMHPAPLQHLYLLSLFTASFNSCINPFIYFAKQPGFRKRLKELFSNRIISCD